MALPTLVKKSKHLSKVLRHSPESVGLVLDAAGWVAVALLLPAMKLSMDELEQVVAENNKKRFEFNADRTQIRASQGHSVEIDLGYTESVPPPVLYHGAPASVLTLIRFEGLKKMGRHHVHLSADTETAKTVGARRGKAVVLVVKARAMLDKGFKFYLSTNGVWLTDQVPPEFIL